MLKLLWGEDIVQKNPEDLDSDHRWLDEGELTELTEVPREEMDVGARKQPEDQGRHELHPEPDLEIPFIPEDPEEIAVREGIHEIIQGEIHHEDKEAEAKAEVPSEWNEVQDLMMEDKDVQPATDSEQLSNRS